MDSKPTNTRRGRKGASPEPETTVAPRRIDRLAEIVDLCLAARSIAEALDEKLLSYLLAMSIQEARSSMRKQVAATAGTVKLTTRRPRARREAV